MRQPSKTHLVEVLGIRFSLVSPPNMPNDNQEVDLQIVADYSAFKGRLNKEHPLTDKQLHDVCAAAATQIISHALSTPKRHVDQAPILRAFESQPHNTPTLTHSFKANVNRIQKIEKKFNSLDEKDPEISSENTDYLKTLRIRMNEKATEILHKTAPYAPNKKIIVLDSLGDIQFSIQQDDPDSPIFKVIAEYDAGNSAIVRNQLRTIIEKLGNLPVTTKSEHYKEDNNDDTHRHYVVIRARKEATIDDLASRINETIASNQTRRPYNFTAQSAKPKSIEIGTIPNTMTFSLIQEDPNFGAFKLIVDYSQNPSKEREADIMLARIISHLKPPFKTPEDWKTNHTGDHQITCEIEGLTSLNMERKELFSRDIELLAKQLRENAKRAGVTITQTRQVS